jgi:hypothetical protein
MAEKRKVLIQLDTDPQPSVFDRVVAVDAGVDELFSYGAVQPEQVQGLVHGAMFTRGPKDLRWTAIFIGGSAVPAAEQLLARTQECFFGPFRVSVMLDPNGANTTAAAAVLSAAREYSLAGAEVLVLGGTGPVGQRVARLAARAGATVRLGSRDALRAARVCDAIVAAEPTAQVRPAATGTADALQAALDGIPVIFAAGAAGITLLPATARASAPSLRVAIDLNAVPPLGIEGVDATDSGRDRAGIKCYGAIGVGGLKMRIHKAAITQLFETNSAVLDAVEMVEIGGRL